MRKLLSLLVAGVVLSAGSAQAQEKAKTPQQEKMALCNQQAEGKKGDDRKAFMSDCLKKKT
jgi:hypothetical protein